MCVWALSCHEHGVIHRTSSDELMLGDSARSTYWTGGWPGCSTRMVGHPSVRDIVTGKARRRWGRCGTPGTWRRSRPGYGMTPAVDVYAGLCAVRSWRASRCIRAGRAGASAIAHPTQSPGGGAGAGNRAELMRLLARRSRRTRWRGDGPRAGAAIQDYLDGDATRATPRAGGRCRWRGARGAGVGDPVRRATR